MDDDGLAGVAGDAHLFDKNVALDIARRVVVVIIEAGLADGDHFRMRRQHSQALINIVSRLRSVVRMHADGGVQRRVTIRQADAGFKIGRSVASADGHHVLDSGGEGALDHGFAVGIELLTVQMTMGVDQRHLSRAPIGTSSRKLASTGISPSREAATIIPCDSTPRSLRGARFATITTLRPTSSSGL